MKRPTNSAAMCCASAALPAVSKKQDLSAVSQRLRHLLGSLARSEPHCSERTLTLTRRLSATKCSISRLGIFHKTCASACPVYDFADLATCSGVPAAITFPPWTPPSGPRSITQSAVLMTSRWCSIMITVLPRSVNRLRTSSSFFTSSKCRPVVGSSRIYRVLPVARLLSSFASLMRCASPPESVVAGCPRPM